MMIKINTLAMLLATTFLSSNAIAADTDFYTLTPAAADDDGAIALYNITETTRYYDQTTGKEVAAADRQEGTAYKEVIVKNAAPQYYTLGLTAKTYGSGDVSKSYNIVDGKLQDTTGAGDITVLTQAENQRLTNKKDIGDINGSYAGLSYSAAKSPYGGAIYNNDNDRSGGVRINNITGDFVGNSVANTTDSTTAPGGGAIYNKRAEINEVSGNFIGNSVTDNTNGGSYAQGGAISNTGTINKISGNFAYNHVDVEQFGNGARGGAIANISGGLINQIDGVFIGNSTHSSYQNHGGAIHNGKDSTIISINGVFIGNNSDYKGGAIANERGAIASITGTFINNSTSDDGGAISSNYNKITQNISGTFIGNKTTNYGGGAIYLSEDHKKSTISGTFIKNQGYQGGAIEIERSDIALINGNFLQNYASNGGAIKVTNNSNVDVIDGNFYDNQAGQNGGAIYLSFDSTVGTIRGTFFNNIAERGGAIRIDYRSSADLIEGTFIGNRANEDGVSDYIDVYGGAIAFTPWSSSVGTINNSYFLNNYVTTTDLKAKGGAIGIFGKYDGTPAQFSKISTISNTLFTGNYAVSENNKAEGGAIFIDENGAEISEILN
ncbi:MAG: hypothetical protein Q4D80_05305, partial [Pseudomonadota bacterium]|nr:hypothetical protein [Pseudomonadota bacterium]